MPTLEKSSGFLNILALIFSTSEKYFCFSPSFRALYGNASGQEKPKLDDMENIYADIKKPINLLDGLLM